jgi:lysophospholipase L1-like esterase
VSRQARITVLAVVVLAVLGFVLARSAGTSLAHSGKVTLPSLAPSPTPMLVPPSSAFRKQLLLLGDSLMYGGPLADDASPPADIARALPQFDVVQFATSGTTIADQLTRLRPIKILRPDVVVIWLGSEDLAKGNAPAGFQQSLEKLIAAMPAVPVILVTPIGSVAQPPQPLAAYIAATKAVASAHRLPLVDVSGVIHARDYMADGVSLTAAACARVSGLIAAGAAPLLG